MTDPTCTIRFADGSYYLGLGACRSRQSYKTFPNAVRAATRQGYVVETTVDPRIEYEANEKKTKIVTSLMTDKLVRIPVNTPHYCDPSSEAYWSN